MNEREEFEPRVLVADDDQSIRQLLATIMRRERLAVDLASDGAEAIRAIATREYSVILLDLMMPHVDGFGVVEHLRQNPPAHKPVVLIISAYADQKFRQIDPEIVAGVLRKPFEVADVGNIVRLCVQGYETARRDGTTIDADETLRILRPDAIAQLRSIRGEGNGSGSRSH